jgi:hypothetical protein
MPTLPRWSSSLDEMHAILLQARGVRWAIIVVSGPGRIPRRHRALVRRAGLKRAASWPSVATHGEQSIALPFSQRPIELGNQAIVHVAIKIVHQANW